jgi:hypothetical protein
MTTTALGNFGSLKQHDLFFSGFAWPHPIYKGDLNQYELSDFICSVPSLQCVSVASRCLHAIRLLALGGASAAASRAPLLNFITNTSSTLSVQRSDDHHLSQILTHVFSGTKQADHHPKWRCSPTRPQLSLFTSVRDAPLPESEHCMFWTTSGLRKQHAWTSS